MILIAIINCNYIYYNLVYSYKNSSLFFVLLGLAQQEDTDLHLFLEYKIKLNIRIFESYEIEIESIKM